ncbi:hypothetical protein JTB14_027712 [Gonioctena quinquepunctata]|nr:hypothetical protein JTB14_027712 [Gonioctena quinquepunctata]
MYEQTCIRLVPLGKEENSVGKPEKPVYNQRENHDTTRGISPAAPLKQNNPEAHGGHEEIVVDAISARRRGDLRQQARAGS